MEIPKIKRLGDYLMATGFAMNAGAYLLTRVALTTGYIYEANPHMAQAIENGTFYSLMMMGTVWLTIILLRRLGNKTLEKKINPTSWTRYYYLILPCAIAIMTGIDFWHDFLLLFLGQDPIFQGAVFFVLGVK